MNKMRSANNMKELALIFQIFFAGAITMVTSVKPPFTSSGRAPWWDSKHHHREQQQHSPSSSAARPPPEWKPVDPNWSWDRRQTGIRPDEWTPYFGIWKHYNESTLLHLKNCTTSTNNDNAGDDGGERLVPWTQGRMCKFLRQLNQSSFELCSVYEPSALGRWMQGAALPQREPNDGLIANGYTFRQTPFRVTELPFVRLPASLFRNNDDDARRSRVTIVQANAATYSGVRWLPTCAQLEALQQERQQQLVHASSSSNDDDIVAPPMVHFHFCEMWLAETVSEAKRDGDDGKDTILEGRKLGLFCQYDTLTGKLVQVFRMREVAVPDHLTPNGGKTRLSPDQTLSLDEIENQLVQEWPAWSNKDHLQSPLALDLANPDKSLSEIIHERNWSTYQARAVKTSPGSVDEQACEVDSSSPPQLPHYYYSPAEQHADDYFDCRFDDGAYARIPKSMHPPTNINDDDDDDDERELCMEFGCVTQSGDLHRLLATGTRAQGGLHCLVYEKWIQ